MAEEIIQGVGGVLKSIVVLIDHQHGASIIELIELDSAFQVTTNTGKINQEISLAAIICASKTPFATEIYKTYLRTVCHVL